MNKSILIWVEKCQNKLDKVERQRNQQIGKLNCNCIDTSNPIFQNISIVHESPFQLQIQHFV